jgi:hypothetical protein
MSIYACFGIYLCLCSGFRGGAPPVMDGIIPGIGPDVDLCNIEVPRVIRRAWFVCLLTEVYLHCWSKCGSRQGCLTFYGELVSSAAVGV